MGKPYNTSEKKLHWQSMIDYTRRNAGSPHLYSNDVVEWESDRHVVSSPNYLEALSVRHLKIK